MHRSGLHCKLRRCAGPRLQRGNRRARQPLRGVWASFYSHRMTDADKLTPADPPDVASALRYQGRKRHWSPLGDRDKVIAEEHALAQVAGAMVRIVLITLL